VTDAREETSPREPRTPAAGARAGGGRDDAGAAPAPGHVPHVPLGVYEGGYFFCATLFVAMLMLTNVIGTKLFSLPIDLPVIGVVLGAVDRFCQRVLGQDPTDALTLTAGIVTYPITFLLTDVVSEVYGRRRADVMVVAGFFASVLMLSVLHLARSLTPSPIWNVPGTFAHVLAPERLVPDGRGGLVGDAVAAQAAYQFTFDAPGTLLFASMTAYLVSQLVDNRMFHFWRRLTRGRALWFRNNMSTGISQFVDTAIVNAIFLHFYWELDAPTIMAIILASYVVKAMLALADTPLCYLGVWGMKRWTGARHR